MASFWVPGPFVLQGFLLFQMVTPASAMDFCAAFCVSWHEGRVYGIKAVEMIPNQSCEGFESVDFFFEGERVLLKLLWEVESSAVKPP